MKRSILVLLAIATISLRVSAQDILQRNLPAVVVNAFQQHFPKAKQVEWEKTADGLYEAEFELGLLNRDHKVYITPEGRVQKHIEEISASSLPAAVKQQLDTRYGGYRTGDVTKIESGEQVNYIVELENRREELKVSFDAGGKVLDERPD